MADPRKYIEHEGINAKFRTFKIDNVTVLFDGTKAGGSSQVGLAVTLSADQTVALTADGEFVLGALVKVESDNYATVQVGGCCSLPKGNAATTTRGKRFVGALGAASAKGYIRDVNTAASAELGLARGFFESATADGNGYVPVDLG
jgi:hypothetical protein